MFALYMPITKICQFIFEYVRRGWTKIRQFLRTYLMDAPITCEPKKLRIFVVVVVVKEVTPCHLMYAYMYGTFTLYNFHCR